MTPEEKTETYLRAFNTELEFCRKCTHEQLARRIDELEQLLAKTKAEFQAANESFYNGNHK